MATVPITVGWTGPLIARLLADGITPSIPLAGVVTLLITPPLGAPITLPVTVVDSVNWIVTASPLPTTLTMPGRHRARFRVVDGAGSVVYFPSGAGDIWQVHRP